MASSYGLMIRMAGVAAVVAAAGGCSALSGSSSAPSTGTTSSSAASAPSSSAPASSSAGSSASQPTGAASSGSPSALAASGGGGSNACATRDLQAKAGVAQGAAGSVYQVIDFTNISNATCTLYGYPGISLAAGTPVTQVGAAASRSTAAAPTVVTLKPGQTANALLRITQAVNYPTSKCQPTPTTYIQIYPPDQKTPMYLSYKSTGCASTSVNLLTIGVMQAGAGSGN